MTTPNDYFGLLGTTLDGKFRVEDIVAEGGFGVVYRGTHSLLERPIALKVLKAPTDLSDEGKRSFRDSFLNEAKTVVRINHPNIVQVLDFGVSKMPAGERALWMALEWLEGTTLRAELHARKRPYTREAALALMRPILDALAYAHEQGVAHRDLKPANLMIVSGRHGKTLKLLDFGIAKMMEPNEEVGGGETRTSSTLAAFSLSYAAPEQISGMRTGPWTDVHAMGLMITELLTGRPPYDGRERTELFSDALSTVRPTPRKRNVDIGSWEEVIGRAVALRAADRYANAGELAAALATSLADDAPEITTDSWTNAEDLSIDVVHSETSSRSRRARARFSVTPASVSLDVSAAPKKKGSGIMVACSIALLAVGAFVAVRSGRLTLVVQPATSVAPMMLRTPASLSSPVPTPVLRPIESPRSVIAPSASIIESPEPVVVVPPSTAPRPRGRASRTVAPSPRVISARPVPEEIPRTTATNDSTTTTAPRAAPSPRTSDHYEVN